MLYAQITGLFIFEKISTNFTNHAWQSPINQPELSVALCLTVAVYLNQSGQSPDHGPYEVPMVKSWG